MDLRIGHLYPDLMSIYGDRGNVLALTQRAKWRGIDVETRAFTAGQPWDAEWADVYFFGGGQDIGQDIVGADLQGEHGDQLQRSIAGGAAVFSVCGGYQLLGREYVPELGEPIPGLGAMDITTRAGKVRFVGNLLAETDDGRMLIGFENHSGYTTLGSKATPLGRVIAGHGNNGADKTEGAVQGKLIGCYLHGSALPKNPWLADRLIGWGLARRFGNVTLDSLDDTEEYAAQRQAAEVAKTRT
jgi:CobQ-like glutamine amidotransferase family enzyme